MFPGGKVDTTDHAEDWAGSAIGWNDINPAERPFRIAAIRELFEETGVLLAKPVNPALGFAEEFALSDGLPFLQLMRRRQLSIDLKALFPFALWRTPPIVPLRFETLFFLARAPRIHDARADGVETVAIEWLAPAEALQLGAEKRRSVVLPTRLSLQRLREMPSSAEAIAAAAQRAIIPIEPRVVESDGEIHLHVDASHGFGDIVERFIPPKPRPSPV